MMTRIRTWLRYCNRHGPCPQSGGTLHGGRGDRLARAATSGESEPFTALKSTLRSLTRPVVAGLFR